MNSCLITYIYGLYEIGKEDKIRYVGKSDNPIKRLRDHRNDKRLTSYKSCWVKSVQLSGNDIGIKILKVVDVNRWKEEEVKIIKEMRVEHELVNLTDGGDGMMYNIYNRTYDECKLWIKENKPNWVNSISSYKNWSKMSDFPGFLPKAPNRVFQDWNSWGDYLGTGAVSTMKRKDIYLSYDEAKKYLKENYNLKSSYDFKKADVPIFIPKKPFNVYSEWSSWEYFLGYKSKKRIGYKYIPYQEAKEWVKTNFGKITSKDYRTKSKNNEIPIFIPKKPEKYYENFSWSDFLYNNGRKKNREFYLEYKSAIEIVHKLNIKSNREWRRWCKNKPEEFIRIPSSPEKIYKENWVNWFEWLGK